MKKQRGFEVANGFNKEEINLPRRLTKKSAGYDFEAAEDIVVKSLIREILTNLFLGDDKKKQIKPTLIPTGIKAYMLEDEALMLYNRSSNPMKKLLILSNGVGVIDSDYYENEDNDGHIMFQFINLLPFDISIKKGERIGQGVFTKFLKADQDVSAENRKGGFGSTD